MVGNLAVNFVSRSIELGADVTCYVSVTFP